MPTRSTYDEVLAEHKAILALIEQLSALFAGGDCQAEALRDHTESLASHLTSHFAREEEGGYFAEALSEAPRLVNRAERLLAEHPKMLKLASALRTSVDGAEDGWRKAAAAHFEELKSTLLQHEEGENGLLFEAYDDDIGIGD